MVAHPHSASSLTIPYGGEGKLEHLEKNLSEQGTEVTTNSNTAGRRVLSPLLKRKGAEVSFYLNYWEIEKTVYLVLRKSVNSGLTMLSNN